MQIKDGRFRGRNDVDAAEKEHQGKDRESENNLLLHRLIDRRISGALTKSHIGRFPLDKPPVGTRSI